ncbi:MAG: hypothetical protein HQL38_17710 [Alphaproteobacteria bacterium]|nr:hypothetical protein [Alphaproteobacteria bacterium]
MDYLAREGNYAERDDLEHLAGDVAKFNETAALVDSARRIRNGRTAEAVAKTLVRELPADSTQEQRRAVAEAEVRHWRNLGYDAVAAVHADAKTQPHIHIAVTARRVPSGVVDRSAGSVVLMHRRDVMADRQRFAQSVNDACKPAVEFFGGRDALLDQPGIEGRRPRRRIPSRDWCVDGRREPAPIVIEEIAMKHRIEREKAVARAAARKAGQKARLGKIVNATIQKAVGEGKLLVPPTSGAPQGGWAILPKATASKAKGAADRERKLSEEIERLQRRVEEAEREIHDTRLASQAHAVDQRQRTVEAAGLSTGYLAVMEAQREAAQQQVTRLRQMLDESRDELSRRPLPRLPAILTAEQVETIRGAHARLGLDPPDIQTTEGQSAAWAVVRAEKAARSAARAAPVIEVSPARSAPNVDPVSLHPEAPADVRRATLTRLNDLDRDGLTAAMDATVMALNTLNRRGPRHADDWYDVRAFNGGIDALKHVMKSRGMTSPPRAKSKNGMEIG